MDALNIILFLYPVSFVGLYFYNSRWAFLFFFATKFTMDMFWPYAMIEGFGILRIMGIIFPLLCLLYYAQHPSPLRNHPLIRVIAGLLLLNIGASLWGYLNSQFVFFPLAASPLSLIQILEWNVRFTNWVAALFILPLIMDDPKETMLSLKCFLISTVIPCLGGLYQLAELPVQNMLSQLSETYHVSIFERVEGFYHDAGTLSIVMFVGIAISVFLFVSESSKILKVSYGVYFLMCVVVLYFTFCRTAWFASVVFLFSLLVLQKKYLWAAGVTAAIILTFAIPFTSKRFENELNFISNPQKYFGHTEELKKLGTGRIRLWNWARRHYLKLDPVSKMIGSGGAYGSHNQFIAWVLKNGLIGLLIYSYFLYRLALLSIQNYTQTAGASEHMLAGFVMAFLFSIIFIGNLFAQWWDNTTFAILFWSLAGTVSRGRRSPDALQKPISVTSGSDATRKTSS